MTVMCEKPTTAGSAQGIAPVGAERRQHPRFQISVDVEFGSGHYFYCGRTRDMSQGGLFIETDVRLPAGAELTVDLRIAGMHAKLSAEVVWVLIRADGKADGLGVRFTSMTAHQSKILQAFMAEQAQSGMGVEELEADASMPPPKKGPPPLPGQ